MLFDKWLIGQKFAECSIISPTFIIFEETSSYWSVQFLYACLKNRHTVVLCYTRGMRPSLLLQFTPNDSESW